jgi:hypothetical protein
LNKLNPDNKNFSWRESVIFSLLKIHLCHKIQTWFWVHLSLNHLHLSLSSENFMFFLGETKTAWPYLSVSLPPCLYILETLELLTPQTSAVRSSTLKNPVCFFLLQIYLLKKLYTLNTILRVWLRRHYNRDHQHHNASTRLTARHAFFYESYQMWIVFKKHKREHFLRLIFSEGQRKCLIHSLLPLRTYTEDYITWSG